MSKLLAIALELSRSNPHYLETFVFFSTQNFQHSLMYVGHPISSDNVLISQKLFLKSELFYPLYVAMGIAYACLKYGVFIIT